MYSYFAEPIKYRYSLTQQIGNMCLYKKNSLYSVPALKQRKNRHTSESLALAEQHNVE